MFELAPNEIQSNRKFRLLSYRIITQNLSKALH